MRLAKPYGKRRALTVKCDMRKFLAVLGCALLPVAAPPAAAEVRYSVRVTVTKTAEAATPLGAAIGQMLAQLAPQGSLETIYVVGPRGVRAELGKTMGQMPAGTVILWKPSKPGELVLLNPAARTYARTAVSDPAQAMAAAGVKMKATLAPPAKAEAIAGIPTQKAAFSVALDFAMAASMSPEARATMAAMQRDSTLTGEIWTAAGRFADIAAIARKTGVGDLVRATGLGGTVKGFVMRQHVRAGGHDVRYNVTKIAEETAPASLFEIPAGYREVRGGL